MLAATLLFIIALVAATLELFRRLLALMLLVLMMVELGAGVKLVTELELPPRSPP